MKYTLPIFIGFLIAVMILINGALAGVVGNYAASIYIHTIGLFTISLCMVIMRKKFPSLKGIPVYLFTGGAIGAFIVLFNNIGFTHLGVSLTLSLGLLGQSITSLIVDHFGLFGVKQKPFIKKKLLPLAIIMAGICLMASV